MGPVLPKLSYTSLFLFLPLVPTSYLFTVSLSHRSPSCTYLFFGFALPVSLSPSLPLSPALSGMVSPSPALSVMAWLSEDLQTMLKVPCGLTADENLAYSL